MMRPNVLLITADDMNFDSLGVTGCKVDHITPHLDRLAAEGIRFEHAHVNIAVCQPSRSALMTGRYPHRNGALGFEPIYQDVPTLQEQLVKVNYYNGIIGKETHIAPKEKFCWDIYIRTMDDENGQGRDPEIYYQYSRGFFEQAKNLNRPFFLMANSHDPHRPFAGSQQEMNKFGYHIPTSCSYRAEEVDVPGFLPDIPDVRKEIAEYYTSVHRCDETVGAILRALRESGQEETTLVMFLSDNGMAFPFAKTNCYLNSTRTPWIVRWPGKIRAGAVDNRHFISAIDYMPTILDAVGLPQIDGMDGRSFLPLLFGKDQQVDREHVFTVFNRTSGNNDYPMRCIQNNKYGYIYNAWSNQITPFKNESQSGLTFRAMKDAAENDEHIAQRVKLFEYRVPEEFYDFEMDPDALNNLADHADYQKLIHEFRGKLLDVMIKTEDPITDRFKRFIHSNTLK